MLYERLAKGMVFKKQVNNLGKVQCLHIPFGSFEALILSALHQQLRALAMHLLLFEA